MANRSAKPVTVTLGDLTERAEARVKSGSYASMSEVLRAGLRALDREEQMLDSVLKARVEQALADPRPAVSLADGFDRLRQHAARRRAALDV
jgi:antitoxin ParD1/3/4